MIISPEGIPSIECERCKAPTPVWGTGVAYVSRFMRINRVTRKRILGYYVDETQVIKIVTRHKIAACAACTDEYNTLVIHNLSKYPAALKPLKDATASTSTRRPVIEL